MSQRGLLILLLAVAVSYGCYLRGEQNPYARYVADGLAAIDDGALEPVPSGELFNGAMAGMVDALRRHGDDHSQFLAEEEADPLRAEIRQQFGGIGVRLGFEGEPPHLTIAGPPDPATPAARANLLPGDHILAIDGQPSDGMAMSQVLRLMRGDPGTTLRLEIQHQHEARPRKVELVREVINIESILGDRRGADGGWKFQLAADPRIAQVRISSFGDRTAAEFERIMDVLTATGVEAVVLDLRDNAGGALDAAVALCDMLLPAGKTIVETKGRFQAPHQHYATTGKGRFLDIPLAVVVNQNSASASEIVAACLQDHQRAIVIGERTYGKGTVQQLVPLESGRSLLKLTWASFWRPSGARIHRLLDGPENGSWGVVPDAGYESKLSPEEYAAYRKYRTERDVIRLGQPTDISGSDESSATTDLVDEPLRMAVEYLQGELEEQSPRRGAEGAERLTWNYAGQRTCRFVVTSLISGLISISANPAPLHERFRVTC